MNCFTVLGIEPTTEKKKIKRAYAAKSREFHPEEHPEEFQRIHDAYEEALAWAERNVESEVEQQMPEEPRQMEMGAAEQEKAAESETWNYAEPERNPEEDYMENPQKEDAQSEESSAQYEELPVHSEESFREEEAGEPPVQLEEDSRTWDSDWDRQFQNMADASERQGADDREIRKIMEQCISLYLNEKERNKLYHWKDILEEPAYREYFRTKTFVESWYHFLDTHRMFDAAIWQYFQWIDGKLFSAREAGVIPFKYPTAEETERIPRQEDVEQPHPETRNPGPDLPKAKKEKSKAVKILLYLAALIGTGIGGMILGIIAGTILG